MKLWKQHSPTFASLAARGWALGAELWICSEGTPHCWAGPGGSFLLLFHIKEENQALIPPLFPTWVSEEKGSNPTWQLLFFTIQEPSHHECLWQRHQARDPLEHPDPFGLRASETGISRCHLKSFNIYSLRSRLFVLVFKRIKNNHGCVPLKDSL